MSSGPGKKRQDKNAHDWVDELDDRPRVGTDESCVNHADGSADGVACGGWRGAVGSARA